MAKGKKILRFNLEMLASEAVFGPEMIELFFGLPPAFLQFSENQFQEKHDDNYARREIAKFLAFVYKPTAEDKVFFLGDREISYNNSNPEKFKEFSVNAFKYHDQETLQYVLKKLAECVKGKKFEEACKHCEDYNLYQIFPSLIDETKQTKDFLSFLQSFEKSEHFIKKFYYLGYCSLIGLAQLSSAQRKLAEKYLIEAAKAGFVDVLGIAKKTISDKFEKDPTAAQKYKEDCKEIGAPSIISFYLIEKSRFKECIEYSLEALRLNEDAAKEKHFSDDEIAKLKYLIGYAHEILRNYQEARRFYKYSSDLNYIPALRGYIYTIVDDKNYQGDKEEVVKETLAKLEEIYGENFTVKDVLEEYHYDMAFLLGIIARSYEFKLQKISPENELEKEKTYQECKKYCLKAAQFRSEWRSALFMATVLYDKNQQAVSLAFTKLKTFFDAWEYNNYFRDLYFESAVFIAHTYRGIIQNYNIGVNDDLAISYYEKADEAAPIKDYATLSYIAEYFKERNQLDKSSLYFSRALLNANNEEQKSYFRDRIADNQQLPNAADSLYYETKIKEDTPKAKAAAQEQSSNYYDNFFKNFNPKRNDEAANLLLNAICNEPRKNRGEKRSNAFAQIRRLILDDCLLCDEKDKLKTLLDKDIVEAAYPYFLLVQGNESERKYAEVNMEKLLAKFFVELGASSGDKAVEKTPYILKALIDFFKFKAEKILQSDGKIDEYFNKLTNCAACVNSALVNVYLAKIALKNNEQKKALEYYEQAQISQSSQIESAKILQEISGKISNIKNQIKSANYDKLQAELRLLREEKANKEKISLAQNFLAAIFLLDKKALSALKFQKLNEAIAILESNNLMHQQDYSDALAIALFYSQDDDQANRIKARQQLTDLIEKGFFPHNFCKSDLEFYQKLQDIPQIKDRLGQFEEMNLFLSSKNPVKNLGDLPKFVAEILRSLKTETAIEKIIIKGSVAHGIKGRRSPQDLDLAFYIKDFHKKTPEKVADFVEENFAIDQNNISIYRDDRFFTVNIKDRLRKIDISIYSNEMQPDPKLSWIASFERNLVLQDNGEFLSEANSDVPLAFQQSNQRFCINPNAKNLITRLIYYAVTEKISPIALDQILHNEESINLLRLSQELFNPSAVNYKKKIIENLESFNLKNGDALNFMGFLDRCLDYLYLKSSRSQDDEVFYSNLKKEINEVAQGLNSIRPTSFEQVVSRGRARE